jgi:hypothetical protein
LDRLNIHTPKQALGYMSGACFRSSKSMINTRINSLSKDNGSEWFRRNSYVN